MKPSRPRYPLLVPNKPFWVALAPLPKALMAHMNLDLQGIIDNGPNTLYFGYRGHYVGYLGGPGSGRKRKDNKQCFRSFRLVG